MGGAGRPSVDEPDRGAHEGGDGVGEKGVMGTAQHQGVHPGGFDGGQVLLHHQLGHPVPGAEAAVLHQGDEEGAGPGGDGDGGIQGGHLPLVGPGADGGGGADESHPFGGGALHRRPGRRGDHPEDGQGVLRRQLGEGVGRDGAAGHHDGLGVKGPQEGHVLAGIAEDGLPALGAVRDPPGVPEINKVLPGQDTL